MKPQVNRGSDIDHALLFSMFRDGMHKSNLVHVQKYFSTSNYNTKYWTVFTTPSQEETPLVNLVLQWASLNNHLNSFTKQLCFKHPVTSKIQLLSKFVYSVEAEDSHNSLRNSTTRREFFSTVTEVIFGNCTSFKLHQKVNFIQMTTEPAMYWLFHF